MGKKDDIEENTCKIANYPFDQPLTHHFVWGAKTDDKEKEEIRGPK